MYVWHGLNRAITTSKYKKFIYLEELLAYVRQTSGGDYKGMCELGELPPQLVKRVRLCIGTDTLDYQLTLDSYGVRHAFAGHSQERGSRDQYPITEADVLALPKWIFMPTTIQEGAKPSASQLQRLQLEHSMGQQPTKTVVILEVRPRYRRLVLVTMYKTKNG